MGMSECSLGSSRNNMWKKNYNTGNAFLENI